MKKDQQNAATNQIVTFKVSDYISEQLHQHYLSERTFEALRPRGQFADKRRLKHAMNYLRNRKPISCQNQAKRSLMKVDDRPVTVFFEKRPIQRTQWKSSCNLSRSEVLSRLNTINNPRFTPEQHTQSNWLTASKISNSETTILRFGKLQTGGARLRHNTTCSEQTITQESQFLQTDSRFSSTIRPKTSNIYNTLKEKSQSLCLKIKKLEQNNQKYNEYADPVKSQEESESQERILKELLQAKKNDKTKLSDQWFKKEGRLIKLSIQRSLELKNRRKINRTFTKTGGNKTVEQLIRQVRT